MTSEVRLMHETLQTFLQKPKYLRALLPPGFASRFPDKIAIRVLAEVIETATKDMSLDQHKICDRLAGSGGGTSTDWFQRHIRDDLTHIIPDSCWARRINLLGFSLTGILSMEFQAGYTNQIFFTIIAPALRSDLSAIVLPKLNLSSRRFFHGPRPRSLSWPVIWPAAKQKGFTDLVVAVEYGLASVVAELMSQTLVLPQGDRNTLLSLAILAYTDNVWSALVIHTDDSWHVEEKKMQQLIQLISTYCPSIFPSLPGLCLLPSGLPQKCYDFIYDLLNSMNPGDVLRHPELLVTEDHQGGTTDLFMWWFGCSRPGRLDKYLFYLTVEAGKDVNEVHWCDGRPAAHWCVKQWGYIDRYDQVACFLLMAKLRVNFESYYKGKTPLQLARVARRRSLATRMLTLGLKRPRFCLDDIIIELLEYHKKHGHWPDLEPYIRHLPRDSPGRWKFDEAGHLILDWDEIDRTGLDENGEVIEDS